MRMGTIKILIGKELGNYFNSWSIYIGYVVFFCVCGFYAWLSANNLFYIGQATMKPVFAVINWLQFLMIPALTMRSFAEEKRNGTLELMLTKPVKTWLLLTFPYYVTLAFLGNLDHGTVLLGYFGLLCMAAGYISIGIFASALSRTPVTAFFVHFGIAICFQLLFGMLAEQFNQGFMNSFFNYLSMEEHFDSLSRGILDSRDILYFCSICAIFLSMSMFCIYKNRY